MKAPVEWLCDFADLGDVPVDELANRLTLIGLEVEQIENVAGESVLVTKVTPNRGDWMSIAGTAREAAAALDRSFKGPSAEQNVGPGDAASLASVVVENDQWCPRFNLRVIRNVKQGPSPDFMQRRLTAAGMRPIGLAVDITNYVMLEIGQPLHAYDYDKVPAGEIVVRAARKGEKIVTLDGVERTLTEDLMVIADRDRPIGIAGIMGGADTEVTPGTTTVLLEAAHFDAGVIRRGSKALGMSTEASYRFERYVDPLSTMVAQERACELFKKYGGATIVPGVIDTRAGIAAPHTVGLRPERVNALLGEQLSADQMVAALGRLEILPAAAGSLDFRIPSFRPDVTHEIDLIEEIGRVIGYENLPETLPAIGGGSGADLPVGAFDSRLRTILIGAGLSEVFTHSLGAPSPFDDPKDQGERVRVRMALSAELSTLRLHLAPSLLHVMAVNLRQRQSEVRIFEVGKTYRTTGPGQYFEPRSVSGLLTGGGAQYADAKGIVESLLDTLHVNDIRFEPVQVYGMHPGRSAAVKSGAYNLGYVAEVDPDMVKEYLDVPAGVGRIAVFELTSERLRELSAIADRIEYRPPPKFPALTRDLAVLFDRDILYGDIESTVKSAAGNLLESISLLSVYTGERVPSTKKSVAVRLVLRAPDRTLIDTDADSVLAQVHSELAAKLAADVRA